jgi:hypothetical protein
MHQGMIALMNVMMPWPFKRRFEKYVVPWTVFTEPQMSHVGMTEKQLRDQGRNFETIEVRYEDYGAAIAEGVADGYVRVHTTPAGRILGVGIVGEGSGEMINEWALAMHTRSRMHTILTLQHSFPTMGFLSKRVAETWMMKRMQSSRLRKMMQFMFRTMCSYIERRLDQAAGGNAEPLIHHWFKSSMAHSGVSDGFLIVRVALRTVYKTSGFIIIARAMSFGLGRMLRCVLGMMQPAVLPAHAERTFR